MSYGSCLRSPSRTTRWTPSSGHSPASWTRPAGRRAGKDDPENETTMSQEQGHAPHAGPAVPQTRTARHRRIVDILNRQPVRSQSQLAKLLADDGLTVTQATLSRDLDELGAVKIRNTGGELIYAVPSEGGFRTPRAPLGESAKEERMARLAGELLISAEASANLVVVRTPPGSAQFLPSASAAAEVPALAGTIAGPDTVLLISRGPAGGQSLADHLRRLAQRQAEHRVSDERVG